MAGEGTFETRSGRRRSHMLIRARSEGTSERGRDVQHKRAAALSRVFDASAASRLSTTDHASMTPSTRRWAASCRAYAENRTDSPPPAHTLISISRSDVG